MEKNRYVKALLIVSGLLGIGIGFALTFFPIAFEASAGIDLGEDINLLSEIRAPSGVLLIGGILIVLGAFISKLTRTAVLLSSLIYLSYGLSRIVGVLMDGLPNESLLMALALELIVGSISLFVLFRFNGRQAELV